MMRALILLLATLVLVSVSHAVDPPAKMWERICGNLTIIQDIDNVSSGGFICATYRGGHPRAMTRFDDDGNVLWYGGSSQLYYQLGRNVTETADGGFIVTGPGKVLIGSSYCLFITKVDSNGDEIWTRIYDQPGQKDLGNCVTELPDGSLLLAGAYGDYAWILRTDANGDTLWTDIQGTHTVNVAKGVEYDPVNNWIVVCMYGRTETLINKGPHLLYYSLDGEYLFGTTYPDLYPEQVRGFCPSSDGGYAILSRYGTGSGWGTLTHTDALGEILWSESVPLYVSGRHNDNLGLGFAQIDGGYICCGWEGWNPLDSLHVDRAASMHGNLSRFDSEGNALWQLSNEIGSFNCFYSVVQLPEGGYIAAGQYGGYYPREDHTGRSSSGYLVRYAPEDGIEEGTNLPEFVLHSPYPNPFSSSLGVSYSLPESMHVSLSVYDITGRLVGELEDSVLEAGEHSSTWEPDELPSGCYVIRLVTEQGIETQNCVFIIR